MEEERDFKRDCFFFPSKKDEKKEKERNWKKKTHREESEKHKFFFFSSLKRRCHKKIKGHLMVLCIFLFHCFLSLSGYSWIFRHF